jgi:hypothetical protein
VLERDLAVLFRTRGPDHFDTAVAGGRLARTLAALGEVDDARMLVMLAIDSALTSAQRSRSRRDTARRFADIDRAIEMIGRRSAFGILASALTAAVSWRLLGRAHASTRALAKRAIRAVVLPASVVLTVLALGVLALATRCG